MRRVNVTTISNDFPGTMDSKDQKKTDMFVRQLMMYRKRIYAFILTLVGNSSDADDIMQDTAALMWEKYWQKEDVSDFAALAMRIAHFKVLEFRKKQYGQKLQFNSELFDTVLGGAVSVDERVDIRFEAMKKCLSKLDEKSRKLIQLRHQKGQTIKSIAASVQMSQHSAYKRLAQMHDILVRCIRRTMREEGAI